MTTGLTLPAEIGVQCRKCEYRNAATPDDPRDGFRECWGTLADPEPHILDYYKPDLIQKNGQPLVSVLVSYSSVGVPSDPSLPNVMV